jgi:hypothetical protein
MLKQVRKSRVFAVVLTSGNELGVYFICRKTELEDGRAGPTYLDIQAHRTPWAVAEKSALIDLLSKAGLTVRFFDPEESQWMEQSETVGSVRVPGPRDGAWGPPRTVAEFEESYLNVR